MQVLRSKCGREPHVEIGIHIGRETRSGNLIVWKPRANIHRDSLGVQASLALGVRVKYRRQGGCAVQVVRKIPRLPCSVRNGDYLGSRPALLKALVVEEEKRPVLALIQLGNVDRTAERETELVELEGGLGRGE